MILDKDEDCTFYDLGFMADFIITVNIYEVLRIYFYHS